MNWAVTAQRQFPGVPIYASKVDFKSAYRRCHLSARTAIQCCTQLPLSNREDVMLVYLRETFRGSPSPHEWGVLAEPICDLANVVMHDDDWNPRDLRSPIQHLVPTPITLDSDIPFGEGRELIVNIPINPRGERYKRHIRRQHHSPHGRPAKRQQYVSMQKCRTTPNPCNSTRESSKRSFAT